MPIAVPMTPQPPEIYFSSCFFLRALVNLRREIRYRCAYLDTVVALFVYDGHVAPAHLQYDVHHRFDLIVIAGYRAGEVLEALFVGKFRACREKGDLQQHTGESAF